MSMALSGTEGRALGRDLRFASDEQLGRVVAIVDALSSRGPADALLDPVRPRLAKLRPSRPPTLTRILFLPLDPAIVPAPQWRAGTAAVPRSALGLLGQAMLAELGALRAELEQEAAECPADTASWREVGRRLWPAAAEVLAGAAAPATWTEQTGLPAALWSELRDGIGAVLVRAVQIEAALRAPDSEPAAKGIILGAAGCSAFATALIVRILLARHPRPAGLALAITSVREPPVRAAAEQAIAAALGAVPDALERLGTTGSAVAAAQATQLAALLDAVDSPTRRTRVQALRLEAMQACQDRLETCLRQDLLAALPADTSADDATLSGMEAAARDARALHGAARQLGGGSRLEQILRDCAASIAGLDPVVLDPVDRIRLLELLIGPEAALAQSGQHRVRIASASAQGALS